ncbi:MAG TPA: fasciclin domain-containing protein [Draconibacterium sp.]|nr:fasciclin domain-containing protein [Draconibacterium sp.]
MKTIKRLKTIKARINFIPVMLFMAVIFLASCNDDDEMTPEPYVKNIVEVAADAGQFNILIQAAQKAGLADYLSTQDGITVFAPTDDAFKMLLSDLGLNSLDDVPLDDLTNILLYHVVGSKAMSTDLESGYFPTLSKLGENSISMYIAAGEGVTINKNTKVTSADIEAKNGVIHVVDKVILPPSVVNIALDNDNFSILVQAVVKAGLVDALSGAGPFTVFAPTNDAFNALFIQLGISGVNDLTAEQLIPILTYHVVSGNVLSTDLANGMVPTLSGENKLTVDLTSGVKINDSEVVAADIQGSNGVVHVINKVLIPQ